MRSWSVVIPLVVSACANPMAGEYVILSATAEGDCVWPPVVEQTLWVYLDCFDAEVGEYYGCEGDDPPDVMSVHFGITEPGGLTCALPSDDGHFDCEAYDADVLAGGVFDERARTLDLEYERPTSELEGGCTWSLYARWEHRHRDGGIGPWVF